MRKNLFLAMLLCCLFLVGCGDNKKATNTSNNNPSINEDILEEDVITEDVIKEETLTEKILKNTGYKQYSKVIISDEDYTYIFNNKGFEKQNEKTGIVEDTVLTETAEIYYNTTYKTVYFIDSVNNNEIIYYFPDTATIQTLVL